MKKPIKWTEEHRREALRRMYELAALAVSRGVGFDAHSIAKDAWALRGSERDFRHNISYLDINGADADREVRRVDGLATGRLVCETGWRAAYNAGTLGSFTAERRALPTDAFSRRMLRGIVRVTRIRRAS